MGYEYEVFTQSSMFVGILVKQVSNYIYVQHDIYENHRTFFHYIGCKHIEASVTSDSETNKGFQLGMNMKYLLSQVCLQVYWLSR